MLVAALFLFLLAKILCYGLLLLAPILFFGDRVMWKKNIILKGCSGGVFNTFSKHVNCSDHMRWEGTMAFAALRHALSLEILESWRQPLS